LSSVARYFHTVRHLRPVQLAGRVWFRLHRPRPDLREAPQPRREFGRYTVPVALEPSMLGPDRFRFLEVERTCANAADWQPTDVAKLWAYNLHYFDDMNARDAQRRRAWHERLLERWIAQNPPGFGEGWEPYPVSRRIVNWVKWALRGNELAPVSRHSLAIQTRWLMERLEHHLLGNHLFANAEALVHAGLYFDGPEASRWSTHGLRLIARELDEQVLQDGGHFELSPMYHASFLEGLLDLVNLLRACGREPPGEWLAAIDRMRGWAGAMCHPDGEIAFFNDAAIGIAPPLGDLDAYAQRLGLPAASGAKAPTLLLAASGYGRLVTDAACLLCDCARVGPDYIPGHAHADTLSFELSLFGRRVLVNSGTSEYGLGPERLRQRGTPAHNTVAIDDQDSSEVWGGFRVARRAYPHGVELRSTPEGEWLTASHDGYRRLPGRNEHRRQWLLGPASLRIEDTISGAFRQARASFHFHPDVHAELAGPSTVRFRGPDGLSGTVAFQGSNAVHVLESTWHPRFGVTVANQRVVAEFVAGELLTRIDWTRDRGA
jgi:uncharacterized heparinase superfamily protein